MKYVGLTNDLERRHAEHGEPADWKAWGPFKSEQEARAWEKQKLAQGYEGGPGGAGWRYGYEYTITRNTQE
ncbi:MAG: hypothetical protein HYV07_07665 [Deltaproteobacteria bacterium]|nr:hypothetical protein [Deltaproteobacteria bacterium]